MKDVTALKALLARVEAGDATDVRLARFCFPKHDRCMFLAYNGDLNAAKALHEAVLPEWEWTFYYDGECSIQQKSGRSIYKASRNPDPARAWLISILKALISEAEH